MDYKLVLDAIVANINDNKSVFRLYFKLPNVNEVEEYIDCQFSDGRLIVFNTDCISPFAYGALFNDIHKIIPNLTLLDEAEQYSAGYMIISEPVTKEDALFLRLKYDIDAKV